MCKIQLMHRGKDQKNVRNPNHHYVSKKYRNTPPICIAVRLPFVSQYFRCPYALRKGKYCQYSSHLYRSTPPICIAIRLPFVSQYFWENLGGCGHRDVPQKSIQSIHQHRGTPPFSVCRQTPRSQSKKSYGVYHFPGKTRERGIHHRSGKKGIHHRASDPEKEQKKGGFHGGDVHFSS